MKIYWNGTSKNIIGPKIRQLRTSQPHLRDLLEDIMTLMPCAILLRQGFWVKLQATGKSKLSQRC